MVVIVPLCPAGTVSLLLHMKPKLIDFNQENNKNILVMDDSLSLN